MPGVYGVSSSPFNYATGSGLTGLDATVTAYSWTFWRLAIGDISAATMFIHNNGSVRKGLMLEILGYNGIGVLSCDDSTYSSGVSAAGYLRGDSIWHHYGISWDGARVRFTRDGSVMSSAALTRVPTVGAPRVTFIRPAPGRGRIFDFRVFPNISLSLADIRAAADPRKDVAGCKGRYFRNWKAPGPNGTVYDETGSGNNLTASPLLANCDTCEEPPWREAVGAR